VAPVTVSFAKTEHRIENPLDRVLVITLYANFKEGSPDDALAAQLDPR
jgi:hypothetical protein